MVRNCSLWRKIKEVVKLAIKGGKYRGYFASFIIFCLWSNRSRSLVCSIEYQWRNECGAINFVCTLFYFVGASLRNSHYMHKFKSDWATERVFELLRKLQKNQLTSKLEKIRGNVTLKCSFSYPSRKEIKVLKDVNFTANFGQKPSLVLVELENQPLPHYCCVFTILIQVRY
jgi:ABC-type multidrug transport system fused ATPase/permease subunit